MIIVSICIILLLSSTHVTLLLACLMNHNIIFTNASMHVTLSTLSSSIWHVMIHDRLFAYYILEKCDVIIHFIVLSIWRGKWIPIYFIYVRRNLFYICAVDILYYIKGWFSLYYRRDVVEISTNYMRYFSR